MILSVDPGKMSGIAFLNMEGVLCDMNQVPLGKKLFDFLDSLTDEIDTIVIENFRIRPGINFSWQEMDTIKVIGMFEYRATQIGAKLVKQEPSCKSIGAKWNGTPIPKDHSISHQVEAYAHGTYYSHKTLGNMIPVARKV